jgi:hypothetical protein
MENPVSAVTGWKFLQEPLYRWALFVFALIMILTAWRAILMRV